MMRTNKDARGEVVEQRRRPSTTKVTISGKEILLSSDNKEENYCSRQENYDSMKNLDIIKEMINIH